MRKSLFSTAFFSLSISILTACNGVNTPQLGLNNNSTNNTETKGTTNLLNESNLKSENTDNEIVDKDVFEKLKQNPNFILLNQENIKAEEETNRKLLSESENINKEFAKNNVEFNELLNNKTDLNDGNIKQLNDGNYLLKIKNSVGESQEVVTLGKNFKMITLASAIKTFPKIENQLSIYTEMFNNIPEDEKEPLDSSMSTKNYAYSLTQSTRDGGYSSNLQNSNNYTSKTLFPRPEKLSKMGAFEIQRHNKLISDRLYELVKIKIIDTNIPLGYVSNPSAEEGAGNGNDRTNSTNPSCTTPKSNGIYKNYNWKNKYFVTSIKNQGSRGTCVAFAVASADEMTIAKKQTKWVNLSEQDYYYKNKAVWWPSVYGDGLDTFLSWKQIKVKNYKMPYENDWNYNPSYSRVDNDESQTYKDSCKGYNEECSETNHQGKMSCIDTPTGKVCGTLSGAIGSSSYTVPGTVQELWSHENKNLALSLTIINLAIGNPVIISADVTPRFDAAATTGYVTYAPFEGNRGGHALHVSGYILNETLKQKVPGAPEGAGGGYLIVKNSWGVCFGDAGYVYLPFDWVKKYTYSMTVRN